MSAVSEARAILLLEQKALLGRNPKTLKLTHDHVARLAKEMVEHSEFSGRSILANPDGLIYFMGVPVEGVC